MSTGVPYNPVCENTSAVDTALPSLKTTVAVAFEPVSKQWTGTQTAVPSIA